LLFSALYCESSRRRAFAGKHSDRERAVNRRAGSVERGLRFVDKLFVTVSFGCEFVDAIGDSLSFPSTCLLRLSEGLPEIILVQLTSHH